MAAEAISPKPGRYLVIDRREPARGSTAASTALVQWEIDEPLSSLIKKLGTARARQAYLASYQAVQKLSRRITQLDIDCDMVRRDTLLLAGNSMGVTALKRETALRQSQGLPSTFLDSTALQEKFSLARDGAILSTSNFEADPVKLSEAMLKIAMQRGVELRTPATVTALSSHDHGVLLELDNETLIAARRVIVATGYEVLPEISAKDYEIASTWALATRPVDPKLLWPKRVLVWEASDPYLYFRTTVDNRIIVGGEDAAFTDPKKRDALIAKKTKRILAKLAKLLPGVPLIADYTWAGAFAGSPTGLPVIGELDELPNVFTILGAGGNGITFSHIASELAAAWVKGKPHALQKLFSPQQ